MDILPDEILGMIFQFLSTAELMIVCVQVCQRWQYVAERHTLALRSIGDERRLHGGTRVVLLTTYPVDLLVVLHAMTTQARHLRELTVHEAAPFHTEHVVALQLLPHLVHLDVFTRPRLLDTRLAVLCQRLETLVVNESVAPGLLSSLAADSRLKELHMYGRALHYPRRDVLALVCARSSQLCALTLRCTELPDTAYEVIGACPNLHALRLYSCWRLMAAGARALMAPRRLQVLHVTGARLLRSQHLADTLQHLPPHLRDLSLSNGWCGDEHVPIIANSAPELRIIELWRCKITASGAQALAAALPKLLRLDLDLMLCRSRLHMLAHHPCLQLVRCIPEEATQNKDPDSHSMFLVNGLRVISTHATYAHKYFRPGGEGYQSTLFYYWTRDILLEPLQTHKYS